MEIVWYTLLFAMLCLGFLLNLMTLPGNWLMILSTALYARLTHWHILGWKTILVLVALGVAGEVIDTMAGSAGAKKAGGTRRGGIGAFVGGIVGGVLLSGLFPIVGTIVGVIVGCFAGALLFEIAGGRSTAEAYAVGVGAAHGRFVGMLVKIAFAGAIFLTGTFAGFPGHRLGLK